MRFKDFDDDATRWLSVLLCIHLKISNYDLDFKLMVMLRSTTGPYGRLVIEVAYGEMIFSLH